MTSKYSSLTKGISDQRSAPSAKKNILNLLDDRARILQSNLVFVNALPTNIASKESLEKDIYFGRYGVVNKLILNPPFPSKKGIPHQAYVTYENELDAALAIVSLDGYKLSDRTLKVSFGTTKYCAHFLRGHQCPNSECFYLHELDKKREIPEGDNKIVFKEQNNKALSIVLQNLEEIVKRVVSSKIENVNKGFPSLTEVLDYLVDSQQIEAAQLDKLFQQQEQQSSQKNTLLQTPYSYDQRVFSENKKAVEILPSQIVKSSSHSIVNTYTQDQKKCIKTQQIDKNPSILLNNLIEKLQDKQNVVHLQPRQLLIQQKIEKLIIKQVLKKGSNQCRSRFIKNAIASRQQTSKLRGIVQKYLIAKN